MAVTNKQYIWKIYNNTGDYITEWTDVIDDPSFTWNINNGPGELVLKLARTFANFGEGYDVAFENKLEIYVQDKEAQLPILIYSGRLNEIRPHFGKDGEWLEVQFIGYASTLADQIARYHYNVDYGSPTFVGTDKPRFYPQFNYTLPFSWGVHGDYGTTNVFAQSFTPSVNNISGLVVAISGTGTPTNLVGGIMYLGNTTSGSLPTIITSGVLPANLIPNKYTYVNIKFPKTIFNLDTSQNYLAFFAGSNVAFSFGTNVQAGAGAAIGNTWVHNNTIKTDASDTSGWTQLSQNPPVVQAQDVLSNLNFGTLFDTTAPLYNNIDPSLIVQDLINNNYQGPITFDLNNSQLTNQPVIYQFNRQDYKTALDRLVELSPPYWFYRINPNNTLQFLPRNDAVLDHTLVLGQHISDASPIHSVNELVTRVTLYGGSEAGQSELIYTDDRDYMQNRYTLKEHLVRDSRVHQSSTAAQFTRDYLDFYGNPSVQMKVTVQDSNGDYKYGYDIESFKVGQRVLVIDPRTDAFKNYNGTADNINLDGTSLDVFDNYTLATPLQIMSIQYSPDEAVLTLANEPITAPHKIDDISGNLIQTQTGNSPLV